MRKEQIKNVGKIVGIVLLLMSSVAFAADTAPSLGTIAEKLLSGTDMVTRFVHFVCVVIGLILFIMAGSFYKVHRFNPKVVPLERPIIYVILGIVLICIPFLGRVFGPTGSKRDLDLKKQELIKKGVEIQDIDAPLEDWGNDYDH